MSHNIKHLVYRENIDRKKVQADLDSYVAREDWEEGCSGLNSPIRWIESCGVLNSYDEALEYIKSHDKGWYDSLAVRFKEEFDGTKTTAQKKAEERFNTAKKKWLDLDNKLHFADVKAAFIGCRHCGSKIYREYLNDNRCPVCGRDMRPKSTLDILERYQTNLDKAKALLLEEEKKAKAKNSKTMWLVKIEYHT